MTFDDFWILYPRKEGKIDAQKAWKQMTRQYSAGEIVEGLKRNLPAIQSKEPQFRKLPAGWLRDGRWMDEPETERPRNYAEAARKIINGSERVFSHRDDVQFVPIGQRGH